MNGFQIIGPNDACLCGSGKTLGQCCLAATFEQRAQHEAATFGSTPFSAFMRKRAARQMKFGRVRGIIHADWKGQKLLAVDNEILFGPWKFFPDFLQFYIKRVLTPQWGKAELQLPVEDRHPIIQWYVGMCLHQKAQQKLENGDICFVPDGCSMAYLLLAYDLYTLRHHQSLQNVVVERLKKRASFQGARYELFVAATCVRAGFSLEYEDETDWSRKHSEFRARHHDSGIEITVEAKSRHREGVLGQPGAATEAEQVRTRIGRLLNQAVAKAASLPHVVFIDVNVPPSPGKPFEKQWVSEIAETVNKVGIIDGSQRDSFNLAVFTNHPFHYTAPGDPAPSPEAIAVLGLNPPNPLADTRVLQEIHDAAMKFGAVPQQFDEAD